MNIGIFTDTYYPEVDGVANSAFQLKNELEKRGQNVYVFTVTNPEVKEDEYHVYRLKSIPFVLCKGRRLSYSPAKAWMKEIASLHLDVIHTQTEFTIGHIGRRMARYLNIPLIHTYHTIYEDYTGYFKIPGNEKLKGIIRNLSRQCCNRAKAVIVPSEKVKNLLERYGVERKIYVQPTGVNLEKFAQKDEQKISELREKYHLTEKSPVLAYVGRVSEEKNISEIINYLPALLKENRDIKMLIVGDGPKRIALEQEVKELGLTDVVIFTGMVPWENIQNYYALGKAFVCASTSETQGLTYLEALASGTPILVRRDECLKGILNEKVNGFGFETKEEFLRGALALLDSENSDSFAIKAKYGINRLSVEQFASHIEEVYTNVLHGCSYGQVRQMVG